MTPILVLRTPWLSNLRLAAGKLIDHLSELREQLERAPLPDADPDRRPGDLRRIETLEAALSGAEIAAASARVQLGQAEIEQVQIEIKAAEALLVLFDREFARAPWDISDGRCDLIAELISRALAAARLVRLGLSDLAGAQ